MIDKRLQGGLAVTVIVVAIVIGTLTLAAFRWKATVPPPEAPAITWSQPVVAPTMIAGQTSTVDLKLAAGFDLQNLTIDTVPALGPFVRVNPSSISALQSGQEATIELTVSVPQSTSPGTYDGTIHVRIGHQTLPQTLKVVINVWRTVVDDKLGLSVGLPPGWTSTSQADTGELFFINPQSATTIASGDVETAPDVTITSIANGNGASLTSFVSGYRNGWFASYASGPLSLSVAGRNAVELDDSSGAVPKVPTFAVFVELNGAVLELTANDAQQLTGFLQTLEIH